MSLIVWLPLDGDLHNLGLSSVNLTNTVTFTDGGKIGTKCLNSEITSFKVPEMDNKKLMSFAYWIKINAGTTTDWLDTITWYTTDGTNNLTCRQEFYRYNSDTLVMTTGIWYNGGSNSGLGSRKIGLWYHYAFTIDYKTGVSRFYVNGALWKTTTNVNTDHYIRPNIANFRLRQSGLNSSINDFRLYDHILSKEEVREIANGLILHYKLDGTCGLCSNILRDTNVSSLTKVKSSYNRYWESTNNGTYTCTFEEIPDPPATGIKWGVRQNVTSVNGFHSMTWYSGANIGTTIGIPYTMSCYVKWISGNDATLKFLYGKSPYLSTTQTIIKDGLWHQYSWTFIPDSSRAASNTTKIYCGGLSTVGEILICGYKLERGTKASPWCEHAYEIYGDSTEWAKHSSIIKDSSGYHHHGTMNGSRRFASDAAKYLCCEYILDGSTDYITTPELGLPTDAITYNIWFKSSNTSPTNNFHCLLADTNNTLNQEMWIKNDGTFRSGVSLNGTRNYSDISNSIGLNGNWHMYTISYDGANIKRYIDGELITTTAATGTLSASDIIYLGKRNTYSTLESYFSDFRIYCTSLLDSEVKKLYNNSMGIDKFGNVHSGELVETLTNLMAATELARAAGNGFKASVGLYRYNQANCLVTCTSDGYHIYRPPNITYNSSTKNMFGGLLLMNSTTYSIHKYNSTIDNIFGLINGHTYVWAFTVTGQSSTVPALHITNYTGYESNNTYGLRPNPTNVISHNISANFVGTKEIYYQFTINDTVIKTCTQSYSDFVKDSDYIAYRDFIWRWDYGNTGELGTDIYVSNIRLYDITNIPEFLVDKSNLINGTCFIEANYGAKIQRDGELIMVQAIER